LLATRHGAGAVEALARGETGVLVGMINGQVTSTPYREIVGVQKTIDPKLWNLDHVLAK
jgi:6-phosphofructokinase 1